MPTLWLADTKFHPPVQPDSIMPREGLRDAIAAAAGKYRLVLLSASAGYGKTTLLSSLAASAGTPTAWFAIDAEDNDPARFLRGVVAATRRASPEFGAGTETLLAQMASMGAPITHQEVIQAASGLINDLDASLGGPLLLILDDLHLITEPLIYALLDYVLEHIPDQFHLAIASRYDPPLSLPRLRANRQLFELRLDDLRFSLDEADAFLNHALYLNLSAEQLALIHTRTGGWVAGLVLLTSAMSGSVGADRSGLLGRIARQERLTFDFLAEEVLNRQPPDLRAFLLKTSILDELTPPLCETVSGRPDAKHVLEDIYRRNLFITMIDQRSPNQRWPVYQHHALFADFLRHQIEKEMPEELAELHRLAAQAEELPGRKIHHFVAAGQWDEAATIIERDGQLMASQGMLATLSDWLAAIPESVDDDHLRLRYLRGIVALARGESVGVDAILDHSLRAYESLDDPENVAASLSALASLAFTQARFDDCHQLAEKALTFPASVDTRVTLLMIQASLALLVRSDWEVAGQGLAEAIALVRKSQSDEALLMLAMYLGQEFTTLPGMLDTLERFCGELLKVDAHAFTPVQLGAGDVMAFIELRRGRLDDSRRTAETILGYKVAHPEFPFLGLNTALTFSTWHIVHKDYVNAEKYIDLAQMQLGTLPLNQVLVDQANFYRARLFWLTGQIERVKQLAGQMAKETNTLPYVPALHLLVEGMFSLAEKRFEDSERQLSEAARMAEREPLALVQATPGVWLAYLFEQWKRPDDALAAFERVLDACMTAGTPGCILQEGWVALGLLRTAAVKGQHTAYARDLLDLLGEPLAAKTAKSMAGLTSREIEVIALIADGASNRAIAERLFISETTVKSHVAHIMNKLGAASRTEVVAQARRLALIG